MKPIAYALRVNNFRRDHTGLLLDAFRPLAVHLRGMAPDARLVFQPHWLDGPHVAFGLAGSGPSYWMTRSAAEQFADWTGSQEPCDLDWELFSQESSALSQLERLPVTEIRRSEDLAVMVGNYTPPWPREHAHLGAMRDWYRSETLDRTLSLIEKRARAAGDAIVNFALTLALLEHVDFAVEGNPWPLSPQGQANASTHLFRGSKAQRAVAAVAGALGSAIEEGCLDDPVDRGHVEILQAAHDQALDFATHNPGVLRQWATDDAPGGVPPIPGMTLARWLRVASNPAHFAYRFTVNHVYDTQPLCGMTVLNRLIACTALISVLETRRPEVMKRAVVAGTAF